ncbi:structural protein [Vibrio methylphosphonaticus]|uniref:structural protein n=1 Tax=Vibrio methylphosphonaticus TaxID=2946866 RepID=UPI00202AA697|nr:structural protein [Vibrio methylphosphonaticus]MCL9777051.1 structural protein [Vibrio methylphosphonaticus]
MARWLLLILLMALAYKGADTGVKLVKSQLNRGIRNNNPLNIRISNSAWTGKVTPSQDKAFETFSDSKYGFRAAAKLIRNYQSLYGLNTIDEIIARWAPSHENDTRNYSQFVAGQLNLSPSTALNLSDSNLLARLVHAMSIMEVGRYYSLSDAQQGVALV